MRLSVSVTTGTAGGAIAAIGGLVMARAVVSEILASRLIRASRSSTFLRSRQRAKTVQYRFLVALKHSDYHLWRDASILIFHTGSQISRRCRKITGICVLARLLLPNPVYVVIHYEKFKNLLGCKIIMIWKSSFCMSTVCEYDRSGCFFMIMKNDSIDERSNSNNNSMSVFLEIRFSDYDDAR